MILEVIVFSVFIFGLINLAFNRRSLVSSILFSLMLTVVMGGNTINPDALNYEYLYNGLFIDSVEPGYRVLMSLGHLFRLNYNQFRFLICLIALILAWIGLQKMVSTLSYKVYVLYFIYPFFLDVIQLRNFIMMSILIFATSFLKKKNLRSEISFIIIAGIGATIQILGVVYLVAILLYQIDDQDRIKSSILFVMTVVTLISMFPIVQSALSSSILNNAVGLFDKASSYSTRTVQHGYYIYWLADYLLLFIFAYLRKHTSMLIDSDMYNLQSAIYSLTTVSTLFFPLYTIDLSFARAFRNIIPLLIVGELISFEAINKKHRINLNYMKKIVICITLIAFGILFMVDILPLFGVNYEPLHENWLINE
ncbi:EpsG family protein [Pediococcus ethanolidurans]|uniref:EpsG family protein n=1 Tax=Pediococcus ethanolidurans TaxID=319653 RepID=UPI001C1EE4D0|nr:EpsG family protein [Pediococcus ethanolidurans]MBU7554186.1 EpsG family protein [Pediococcus ethanolidurans]